jgi:release factor H-coupled RctB family protein
MNRNLLIQEHPDAYKQVDDVVRDLETFGMAQRLACLLPVFTYKD